MSNLMMPSRVLLYGRVVQGIRIDVRVFDAGIGGVPGLGSNRFLREQFDPSHIGKQEPCFAMIYGFEFEAHYHDLMAPTIMLVHGEGLDYSRGRRVVAATAAAAASHEATAQDVAGAAASAADGAGAAEIAAAAAAAAAAGEEGATAASVAAAAAAASAADPYIGRVDKPFPDFADNVRIWPYDKADFSMRLDPCSGPIESILLEAEIDEAEIADEMAGRKVSGRKVGGYLGRGRKVSGRKVGISGRKVRGE
ncbi:MAG: hypothetical protein JSU67_11145 [Gammaproteobacteria bacterium]|nr:MAG: hypothetical protein EP300_08685 [Gammaproteobacteria bacterium]UCH38719.1 MAG: hypothetical protein JSU67_11145 [Gammaproteobacteria bacterium]